MNTVVDTQQGCNHQTATMEDYLLLRRDERELICDDCRKRLQDEQEAARAEIARKFREAIPESDPETDAAFARLMAPDVAEREPEEPVLETPVSPLVRIKDPVIRARPDNTPEHCPNARQIVTKTAVILVPCHTRGCLGSCRTMWIEERAYSVYLLTLPSLGSFRYELFMIKADQWPTLSKAMQRRRKAGFTCNGVKGQVTPEGMFSVLVQRDADDDKRLSTTIPSAPVADPVLSVLGMLTMVADASQVADVGRVQGLGEWNGMLTPPDFSTTEDQKLIGVIDRPVRPADLKKSIVDFGGRLGRCRPGRVEYSFESKLDEATWYAYLGFVDDREDRHRPPPF